MKPVIYTSACILFLLFMQSSCENEEAQADFSGIYCLNFQNLEMIIAQQGSLITFTIQNDVLVNGTGILAGDTLVLNAQTMNSENFTCTVTFSGDANRFAGPFTITNDRDQVTSSGVLMGIRGECSTYDIDLNGVPKFIRSDFTQLDKIEKISKFRSGFGHSFTDGTESCRSMKHYFNPYSDFRDNDQVEIYSPVNGILTSVSNDGHGASTGLTNKVIQIKPDDQPAFICEIFHCDLLSASIETGKKVQAGELLGHARLYYPDLEEYSTSFDVAIWAQTPSGTRLLSYFDVMTDELFAKYFARGPGSRNDLIISKESRDADPIQCNGEVFLTGGNLENWFTLNSSLK